MSIFYTTSPSIPQMSASEFFSHPARLQRCARYEGKPTYGFDNMLPLIIKHDNEHDDNEIITTSVYMVSDLINGTIASVNWGASVAIEALRKLDALEITDGRQIKITNRALIERVARKHETLTDLAAESVKRELMDTLQVSVMLNEALWPTKNHSYDASNLNRIFERIGRMIDGDHSFIEHHGLYPYDYDGMAISKIVRNLAYQPLKANNVLHTARTIRVVMSATCGIEPEFQSSLKLERTAQRMILKVIADELRSELLRGQRYGTMTKRAYNMMDRHVIADMFQSAQPTNLSVHYHVILEHLSQKLDKVSWFNKLALLIERVVIEAKK